MYKKLYTYQGPAVFHYQMTSTNASNAVSTEVRREEVVGRSSAARRAARRGRAERARAAV